MNKKNLISINDFSFEDILKIMDLAVFFEENQESNLFDGYVFASLFFEPSTRTRLSFESAIKRLGGRLIGFSDSSSSSVQKGESLKDTILTVSNYCDLIVMRHPLEGAARWAGEVSSVPFINAGDGANQHPTQTLLDLYSIKKTQGTLNNLNITIAGDLKYGRTVHSLIMALSHFNPTFNFISHEKLRIHDDYKVFLINNNIKFKEYSDFSHVIDGTDILYMTRVQKERFADPMEYEKTKDTYILYNHMLKNTKDNFRVLHPLPRVNEINQDIDTNPKAYYFQQALNGVYTRQAIIAYLLNLK